MCKYPNESYFRDRNSPPQAMASTPVLLWGWPSVLHGNINKCNVWTEGCAEQMPHRLLYLLEKKKKRRVGWVTDVTMVTCGHKAFCHFTAASAHLPKGEWWRMSLSGQLLDNDLTCTLLTGSRILVLPPLERPSLRKKEWAWSFSGLTWISPTSHDVLCLFALFFWILFCYNAITLCLSLYLFLPVPGPLGLMYS